MKLLARIFSGGLSVARLNFVGVALMAAALVIALCAGKIARKLRGEGAEQTKNAIKIVSLVVCAGGAMLAILG